tara:strand:+ start:247 stop:459 length:213 start_codon:yes stop_codon:yes gene_type:complete
MEENKTEEEEKKIHKEVASIGAIELESSIYDAQQLASIIVELLKDKDVKKYLELLKTKAIMNGGGSSYLG